ncbi:MAG: MOSC domain-containing protein [Pseudomonadota bacterium]
MSHLKAIAIKNRSRVPMQSISSAKITVASGILGDFRGSQLNRQITILSETAWHKTCESLNVSLPWTARRANLLVDDVEFDQHYVGRTITIGAAQLIVTEETVPCSNMDAQQPGLTQALMSDWRGGICCKVIKPGEIEIGDLVEFS